MSDICRNGFQFGLVCLIMAAFTGLAGFLIVYHYATFERPIQHYAIVIDAGSTQTRSSLFKIGVDLPKLIEWRDEEDDKDDQDEEDIYGNNGKRLPLTELFQVRQVSSCVNGGPLAAIKSEQGAIKLVKKCLTKFADQIKRLDFKSSSNDNNLKQEEEEEEGEEDFSLETEEFEEKMAIENHRVNSETHLYLGATAGMRALGELNETKASEKVQWINSAINQSSEIIGNTISNAPQINKGFVGIIQGTDEATFGWISVNFVCDRLEIPRHTDYYLENSRSSITNVSEPKYNLSMNEKNISEKKTTETRTNDNDNDKAKAAREDEKILKQLSAVAANSVGTLELGGASSQIAYRVPNWLESEQILNMSLREQNLDLFNEKYKLATRSDLCLGMSQAVLRIEYILMRDSFLNHQLRVNVGNQQQEAAAGRISTYLPAAIDELENPCMQSGSHMSINSIQLADQLNSACLIGSKYDLAYEEFKNYTKSRGVGAKFRGSGNTKECNQLLRNLLDPQLCRKYFSICPRVEGGQQQQQQQQQQLKIQNINLSLNSKQQPRPQPPSTMPFVTISGYNKALLVLNLQKMIHSSNTNPELSQVIASKLGGYSINYTEFTMKTREFCQVDISEFPIKFPKMNKAFYAITCLQLVYIDKLLTEFYQFDPNTSWNQIKFLLFPIDSVATVKEEVSETTEISRSKNKKKVKKHEFKNDIGWTLGLLLNATSNQYGNSENHLDERVFHHHKSSVMYVMTSTLLLMLASFAFAISVIVVAIFAVRNQQRRGRSYISHHSNSSFEGTNQEV